MQIPNKNIDNHNEIDVNAILLQQLKWNLHQRESETEKENDR